MKELFPIRGFNPCESLLRHTPEQLRNFIRRMKALDFNTIIIHYDYGWKRYRDLILEECRKANVEITLMTFGPRTFYRYTDWKKEFFARREDGSFFTEKLECETFPCRFAPGALEAFEEGARAWLAELPPEIRRVHMRAADGRDFCRCPKCRVMPQQERWTPFIERFAKAVQENRPDLAFETDIYIHRYALPENLSGFSGMERLMFDTFPRTAAFPLGSTRDLCTQGFMQKFYGSAEDPFELTANDAMLQRLKVWNQIFPGKVYIHENVMRQGLHGNYQLGSAASYLEDLKIYRELGIPGVCFEAFEPGYSAFAGLFELLSKAMKGEKTVWTPEDPDQPIERYITDPVQLKSQQLYKRFGTESSLALFREYMEFVLENEASVDTFYIGCRVARTHLKNGSVKFRNLSPEAVKMLELRKLWDFMEDIPDNEDPRLVCRTILNELLQKSYENQ